MRWPSPADSRAPSAASPGGQLAVRYRCRQRAKTATAASANQPCRWRDAGSQGRSGLRSNTPPLRDDLSMASAWARLVIPPVPNRQRGHNSMSRLLFAGGDRSRGRRGRSRHRAELSGGHTGSGLAPRGRCGVRADERPCAQQHRRVQAGCRRSTRPRRRVPRPAGGVVSSATCRWTRSPPRTPSPTTGRTACCSRSTPAATPSPASGVARRPPLPSSDRAFRRHVPGQRRRGHGRLYVLNAGGSGNVTGYRINPSGRLAGHPGRVPRTSDSTTTARPEFITAPADIAQTPRRRPRGRDDEGEQHHRRVQRRRRAALGSGEELGGRRGAVRGVVRLAAPARGRERRELEREHLHDQGETAR